MAQEYLGHGLSGEWRGAAQPPYGDVPMLHPALRTIRSMEAPEKDNEGRNPDAPIPRFLRQVRIAWGKLLGL
ncbi:MAG TPA: hypothetical protein VG102_02930 [Candidatus Paceibacterota bacterium]|jgi:hypothetical protein|nr:hypothetical protein [Candidatus Paceibacterota bacterium]